MDRKVVWTDAAVDDLETAAEYISKDSPSYAAEFRNLKMKQFGKFLFTTIA